MKEIKYKECYVVGDCLHIQFLDGESFNFLLDSVVEEMVGGLTPPDPSRCTSDSGEHYYLTYEICYFCKHERG